MSLYLQELVDGKIDFAGQDLVEQLSRITIVASSVVAFVLGFAMQDLRVTFGIVGFSMFVLALVVIPPWPMFNRHPVKWLPKAQ